MRSLFLAAISAVALQATAASAADVIEEAIYDWSGLYAGLNAGYAFGGDDDVGLYPTYGHIGELNLSGLAGGIGVGYNMQLDQIVLGIEGDIQLSGISDDDDAGRFDISSGVNYFGTLRARAGFAFDRTLIFATGGLAFGDFDYEVNGGGAPGVDIDENFSRWGYAVGGGVEHAFDESWSLKAEYLYASFGKESLSDNGETTKATPDFHLLRVGVNYRF
jgi:outer membrane immunogenic protein